jgi:cysteine desulfurase
LEKLKIYFDNAATTPPLPFEDECFANPSSPHTAGIHAERALNTARAEITGLFSGIKDSQCKMIFTSGGTESNNLALLGFALANRRQNISIFAEPWEHPSVTEPIRFLAEQQLASPALSSDKADLVSMSHVLYETGDINDVPKIAELLKKENPKVIIHVDGVQGFCKEKSDMTNADMYTFSGHKIHGAHVGGLLVCGGVRLVPLVYGGGQEFGIRSGTENIQGILQTARAAKILDSSREENRARVSAIKTELAKITEDLSDCVINSLGSETSPYILNISFLGIKGETLVHMLSEKGIYASMGAACRSRKKQKSVLELMGFSAERAQSAVRFSFSHLNTIEEAAAAKEIIISSVKQIRQVLGRS